MPFPAQVRFADSQAGASHQRRKHEVQVRYSAPEAYFCPELEFSGRWPKSATERIFSSGIYIPIFEGIWNAASGVDLGDSKWGHTCIAELPPLQVTLTNKDVNACCGQEHIIISLKLDSLVIHSASFYSPIFWIYQDSFETQI